MHKYLLMLSLLILFSCSDSEKSTESLSSGVSTKQIEDSDFANVIDLTVNSDSVKISTDLFVVYNLVSNNDLVIALEKSNQGKLFRVFSTRNGEYLGGFGFTGPGPLDLEFAQVSPRGVTLDGNILQVSDNKSLRTFLIDTKGVVESGEVSNEHIKLVNRIPFPGALIYIDNPTLIGDSVIYGKPSDSKELLIAYNLNDKSIKDVFPYPNKYSGDIDATSKSGLYNKIFRYSPLHEKIVVAFSYFPLVRIYNLRNSKYLELQYKPKNDQVEITRQGMGINEGSLYNYFGSVDITDKGFYVSYDEFKFVMNGQQAERLRAMENMEVQSYDWSGNPRNKYIFPRPAWVYTTTPDDSKIFYVKPNIENYIYFHSIN
ncbi:BF3164 family lipoprotein [Roseivirga echinicomitans]